MLERIERLALGVDGLNALVRKHIEQLGMYRIDAVDELLKVVGKLLAAGMVDRALDIVDHRQQRGDKLLGRALALGKAQLLHEDDPYRTHTAEAPEAVTPQPLDIAMNATGTCTATLPAISWISVEFHG